MIAFAETHHPFDGTDGFTVECRDGRVGSVEEIWLDPSGRARALVVRPPDGKRGVLLHEHVITIDR